MSGFKTSAKRKRHHTAGNILFSVINYTVFIILTLICIYPFYYLFINTISANDLSANGEINFLPKAIHFRNYIDVLKIRGLANSAFMSAARTAVGTVCTVVASAFLGFMFTQKDLWGRRFWYRFIVVTMYFNAGLIPVFITYLNLGLRNTFWVYIIPVIVQPFFIILAKTYIESVPSSMQEAAEIDGAGILTIFFRIMLPVCTPIMATIAIFAAVNQWNSFQDVLLYITEEKLQPLQYTLYKYINQANSLAQIIRNSPNLTGAQIASLATRQNPTSVRMTVSVIVVLPILFVYPFFQRYFVKGIMIGSVKG